MESAQRNTRQRQVILDELRQVTSHPTAAAIYELVRRRLPKISLGTVYRNLELLARTGLIRKLEVGGAEARFDGNIARHEHVRCQRCGRLDDVQCPPLDLGGGPANDWGGYKLIGYRLELFGICPACRGRPSDVTGEERATASTSDVKHNRDRVRVCHKPR